MRLTDAECRARFAAARVAHLATAGADGAPR
ncbi:F420-dependent protein, partial [Carbonactinospora thermoautotrophica]